MTDSSSSALVPAPDSSLSFGQTDLDASSFIPPRVKIVQQMSKEFADKVAEPGDLYNTLTGETYGPSIQVLLLQPFQQRVLLVRENRRDAIDEALELAGLERLSPGDGLKCRSVDMHKGNGEPGVLCAECPLSQWHGNVPPLCTETYNVAATNEIGELLILSFAKSSAKVGKRVFSMLRMRPGVPWASLYDVSTRQERNDKGVFYVPDVRVSKDKPAPELIAQAESWARQLRGIGPIDVTPVDDTEVEDAEPEEAPF